MIFQSWRGGGVMTSNVVRAYRKKTIVCSRFAEKLCVIQNMRIVDNKTQN